MFLLSSSRTIRSSPTVRLLLVIIELPLGYSSVSVWWGKLNCWLFQKVSACSNRKNPKAAPYKLANLFLSICDLVQLKFQVHELCIFLSFQSIKSCHQRFDLVSRMLVALCAVLESSQACSELLSFHLNNGSGRKYPQHLLICG